MRIGLIAKEFVFFGVTFSELRSQVSKIEPSLSAEGKLLVALFLPLYEQQEKLIKTQSLLIKKQAKRIKHLEDKLAINSSNSSKPPSKDDFKPPKARSLRQKTGKKPGGQQGHKGSKSQLRDNPDDIIPYIVTECPDCGLNLSKVSPDGFIRKQVEDIPPLKTVVTEHKIEIKTCPCCATQWQASGCPEHIKHEFQYGPRIKAISVYLSTFQFIPAYRTKLLMKLFGVKLSTGTLDNFRWSAARQLPDFLETLRFSIIASLAGFFDETGMKIKGVGYWVHVAATKLFSLFIIHPKRGREAHEAIKVLPWFKGILHRDDYHSYHTYPQATDALCVAHLLRDLIYAIDRDEQGEWADPLIKLLLQIKGQKEDSSSGVVDRRWQGRHRKRYQELIGTYPITSSSTRSRQSKGARSFSPSTETAASSSSSRSPSKQKDFPARLKYFSGISPISSEPVILAPTDSARPTAVR
ncbi:MAG: transposase [Neolewinella sp.]